MKPSEGVHRVDVVLVPLLLVKQALYHFSSHCLWFDTEFQIQPHDGNAAGHQAAQHSNWDDDIRWELRQEAGKGWAAWSFCHWLHSGLAWGG